MKRVIDIPDDLFKEISELYNYNFEELSERFTPNGPGRRFKAHIDPVNQFNAELFKLFGIYEFEEEGSFGNFMGNIYEDGGSVHSHTDPALPGMNHCRINVAIDMPNKGGHPIIEGKMWEVKKGQAWICFANKEEHSTVPNGDGGQRKIFSFGGSVPREISDKIYSDLF